MKGKYNGNVLVYSIGILLPLNSKIMNISVSWVVRSRSAAAKKTILGVVLIKIILQ